MENSNLLLIYNSIPFGVCVINQSQKVIYVNDAFERYAHRKKVEKRPLTALFPIFSKSYFQSRLNTVFNNQMTMYLSSGIHGPIFGEKFLQHKSYFEVSISPVSLPGQTEKYAVLTIEEVTDLMHQIDHQRQLLQEVKLRLDETMQAKEALRKSQRSLCEANKAKDQLFSIIGHDLRTPFNALIGISEVLLQKVKKFSYANDKASLYEAMWLASKQGLDLVNNLLNWARTQTGRIQCYPVRFDLSKVCLEVHSYLIINARKKDICLDVTMQGENFRVFSDVDMIKVIVQNLLGNAIKFTPNGGQVDMRLENWGRRGIRLVVKDTGIGMSDLIISKILNGSTIRSGKGTEMEGGTGLGLVICKEFLSLNNSELSIKSKQGAGTEVSFYLPSADY